MNEHLITSAVNTMNTWVIRRRVKGAHPNADEIWARMKENWPAMPDDEREEVFQRLNANK